MKTTVFKLSKLDVTIIKQLLQNGRKSFAEIAKTSGVTKNKVWKRYKVLERKGIIKGSTIQMNLAQFGFEAVATLLISVDAQHTELVMENMERITEVLAFRQYDSVYNVRAMAKLKDLNELDHVKQAIKRKLPTMGLRTYIWTDIRNSPENLSLSNTLSYADANKERRSLVPTHEQNEAIRIDELDMQIIEKLISDGRASFRQIAKEIGTSTDTIMKRYYKLEKKGAIKVSIQIDPKKLGYNAIMDFDIAFASAEKLSGDIVDSLAKISDVIVVTKTSGDYDLQLTAMIRDIEQSFALQEQIARTCSVTKIDVSARKIPDQWPPPKQYISTF
jgi:DNA-binding Lrp family transcriptional regulator